RHAATGYALSKGGPDLGRADRVGAAASAQLAVDGFWMFDAVVGRGRWPVVATGPFNHYALRGGGRQTGRGTCDRPRYRGLSTERCADRTRTGAFHTQRALAAAGSCRVAGALAGSLRL